MALNDAPKYDHILDALRGEFLVDVRERLEVIEEALGGSGGGGAGRGGGAGAEALLTIRREAHNLKGMGGSFGFPVISLIAHRL